jgi:tetrahydromethanopterin S-methyltransferase subunit F
MFGSAHSVVCVCSYCNSLIARAESTVEELGKVPDLVAIDTRLALGVSSALTGAARRPGRRL